MTIIHDSDTVSSELLLQVSSQLEQSEELMLVTTTSGLVLAATAQAKQFFNFKPDAADEIWLFEYLPQLEHIIASGIQRENSLQISFSGQPDTVLYFQGRLVRLERQQYFLFKFQQQTSGIISSPRETNISYQQIFDNSELATGMLNRRGEVLDLNEAALKFVNMPRQEALGKNLPRLLDMNPYEKSLFSKYLDLAFNGETQKFDWWCTLANGELITIEVTFKPVVTGDTKMVVCTVADTWEKASAEQNVLNRNNQLEFVNYLLANLAVFKKTEKILRFTIQQLMEKRTIMAVEIKIKNTNKN